MVSSPTHGTADPDLLLACDPATLLRSGSFATTPRARAGFQAYQLSTPERANHPDQARWWLHVWARKTQCHTLATRTAPTTGANITAAMWTGHSHLRP